MQRFARVYTGVALALLPVAALTATSPRWDAVPWLLACLLGLTGIVAGIRAHRPGGRRFWIALAAMEACWAAAAFVTVAGWAEVSSGSFSLAAALYFPGYFALAWATASLLRRIGVGRPETLDAAIGATLVAAALWPVLLAAVHHTGRSSWVGGLFPFWDVLLAMLVLRLAFSSWFRKRAIIRLGVASVLLVVSDLAYFSGAFDNSPLAARLLSMTYTGAYAAFGAAALGRSMRRVPPRSLLPEDGSTAGRRTLGVVAVALLLVPGLLAAYELRDHSVADLPITILGVVVVALVITRIALLLRRTDELRRRAEASERLFRLVFEAAGIGISVGRDGRLERTNPALQQMFGYRGDELARMHFTELTHPDDLDNVQAAEAGRTFTFQRRILRKDGETIWAEVTLTAPSDDSFGIAVIEDITAAKQLEDDLRHAQKMEAVGQLAGGIAHDFNNLMTAVIGYASMLRAEIPADDERRSRVDAITAAAERAAELTRKLLAFSRRQVLRLEPVDVAGAVRDFRPIVDGVLRENIVLDYDLEPGIVARVDRAELEQVVLNLVLNARDAMPDGGLISVSVRAAGGAVELSVADTGVGMDEETRQRIFDPFFTTKPVGQGTGLGLATVDGIVGQLGGTIDVVSSPGEGTTFTVRLPLALDLAPVDTARKARPVAAPPRGTVLLVEDEESVRHVTDELLRLSGYEVVAAASAEDALTLLGDGMRPDVLVSDVVMTGLGGPALAERAREILPDLPVLFVSGYPADSFRGRMTELVLTKPFTSGALASHIEQVRRAAPVPA